MMHKRGTHKTRRKKKPILSYKRARKLVEETVKDSVRHMKTVRRLDNIVIESIYTDSWGEIAIYTIKGYIEAQVKTGFFSTKQGKKVFTATAKAKTREMLAINWEPGEIN
ncbi:hypothetical protein KAU85_02675 [Candidatus Bathyarchaeota archaeon]|nr:hypothetical protein [Candidatus Bathyarchaeota archaeon]MCK4482175.1 hypothetical protein [Candidatus Bathyarchaeota archaeon]